MLSRRSFFSRTLNSSTLVALSSTVPDFLARSARAAEPAPDERVLVVIELNGGNDGINTVVPYRDEGYQRHRSATRLATRDLIKIDDQVGLHPSMSDAARLLNDGKLAIVQGSRLPQPEPVSLRKHEDLAHRPPRRGRRRRLRLDRPGAGRTSGDFSIWSGRDLRRQLPIASRRARPPVGCDHVGSDR